MRCTEQSAGGRTREVAQVTPVVRRGGVTLKKPAALLLLLLGLMVSVSPAQECPQVGPDICDTRAGDAGIAQHGRVGVGNGASNRGDKAKAGAEAQH